MTSKQRATVYSCSLLPGLNSQDSAIKYLVIGVSSPLWAKLPKLPKFRKQGVERRFLDKNWQEWKTLSSALIESDVARNQPRAAVACLLCLTFLSLGVAFAGFAAAPATAQHTAVAAFVQFAIGSVARLERPLLRDGIPGKRLIGATVVRPDCPFAFARTRQKPEGKLWQLSTAKRGSTQYRAPPSPRTI